MDKIDNLISHISMKTNVKKTQCSIPHVWARDAEQKV